MKKLLFLLLILIPLISCGQATHKSGVTVQDSLISEGIAKFKAGLQIGDSITGSNIWTVDSLVFSITDTAIYINGNRIPIGSSGGSGSGASTFLELTDTPGAYTPLYLIRVNAGGTALAFINPATYAVTNFLLVTTLGGYTISDTKANFNTALSDGSFAYDGGAFHDGFSDFLASEHVIWAITGVEDIHDDRITESSVTQHSAAIIAGGSGMTLDGTALDLGGALDAPTTITGTEVNNLALSFTDAGDRTAQLRFSGIDGLSMRAQNTANDSSIIRVDSSQIEMAVYDGAAVKRFFADTNTIEVRDDDRGRGLSLYADYSAGLQALDVTPKTYVDLHLGSINLDATVYSPSDAEHGGVLTYDSTGAAAGIDEYLVTPVVSVAQAAGMMIESFDTIIFSTTTLDTIVVLPVGAVVWDIQVYLNTAFDGSGTNLLDVGIDGEGDRYIDDFDLENPATTFYGLGATPDRIPATTEIIFQYTDSGADAAAGLAFIYVKYTIH